ncbi:MAG: glutamate-5-semialdehyde dehydrogenase [Oscillospiraceae bacterium]|nr:glutamate-5-semialdehyde dehydrogenase [Oscillospiraceae bacterium]
MTTQQILINAKSAKNAVCALSDEVRSKAVCAMADALLEDAETIFSENAKDLEAARGKISDVMLDRLRLTEQRIADMAASMKKVATLSDPLSKTLIEYRRDDGLLIKKVSVPIGVVAIIYESRPNVTADVAALCLKSGNVSVLRGGKEAFRSANAIVTAMRKGLALLNLPETLINLIEDTSRDSANELMRANGYVDLLIPRGGKGLIDACVQNATVPCIQTGTGICHIYVDKAANFTKALDIIDNAKTSRPSVCNAAEVCLVHKEIANEFLPLLSERLSGRVELRLCPESIKIIDGTPASDTDFDTEFLDYILAVKVVDDVKAATLHISTHSTGHSEAIVSEDTAAQEYFTRFVDSAAVYVNASTRFTDGGEFGLGCEMGISTQKMHARGPMGIAELTAYKYIIEGNGHTR